MKKTYRNLLVKLSPALLAAILAGCTVVIESEAIKENAGDKRLRTRTAVNEGEYCNLADKELYRKFYAPEWGDSCNLADRAFYEKLAARQR